LSPHYHLIVIKLVNELCASCILYHDYTVFKLNKSISATNANVQWSLESSYPHKQRLWKFLFSTGYQVTHSSFKLVWEGAFLDICGKSISQNQGTSKAKVW